ncbi:phosphatidylinositol glycan, class c [Culex quinquefasciatus]|uniref:Phosphatidylinositol glycan, class c n=1 Tax=Culex quinquefasciatus TaxID=7176 RepID=B0W5C3_CULQU|nr:phosphatidylinositol glycan, class c [Culex quinquefasciatus]|eukprot:XP_001843911.1 phosphatidylinositol glycan, class c [Culex quinquefasciatus]
MTVQGAICNVSGSLFEEDLVHRLTDCLPKLGGRIWGMEEFTNNKFGLIVFMVLFQYNPSNCAHDINLYQNADFEDNYTSPNFLQELKLTLTFRCTHFRMNS